MQYLKLFDTHAEYAEYIDSQDAVIPNVSYCVNEKEVHNKSKYTLTIVFSFDEDFGITPPQNFVQKYINGATYRINSPIVEGCTPSESIITGTMPAHDLTINVVYSRNTYTILVRYLYLNNSNAFPPQTFSFKYKDEYHIVPPQLTGFRVNPSEFRGTMPATNTKTMTFWYLADDIVNPDDPDTPI